MTCRPTTITCRVTPRITIRATITPTIRLEVCAPQRVQPPPIRVSASVVAGSSVEARATCVRGASASIVAGSSVSARASQVHGASASIVAGSGVGVVASVIRDPALFITKWRTTSPGESITLPLKSAGTYDFDVDWGDGTTDTITAHDAPERVHIYADAGEHEVAIRGTFEGIDFNATPVSKGNILDVSQWGGFSFGSSAQRAFYECSNLDITAPDAPHLTGTLSFHQAFRDCTNLIGSPAFGEWDMSGVTSFYQMFVFCSQFNQPLNNWDTSSLEDAGYMFYNTAFDQPLNDWDTSMMRTIREMFRGCPFDQDISMWDVGNIINADHIFNVNTEFSTENYDKLLIGWAAQDVQPNVAFGAPQTKYSAAAQAARDHLVNNQGWIITDGGMA